MRLNCLGTALSFLLTLAASVAATGPDPALELPPPVMLTAQQDHQRLLGLLDIQALRRGADGRNPEAPNAANYDETKANPYPDLPEVLRMADGRPVTRELWPARRAEIVDAFDREVYGRVPAVTPKVTWETVSVGEAMEGETRAVRKQLIGRADNAAYPHVKVEMRMTLATPAAAPGPVPVMLEFGFSGFAPRPGAGPTWQQLVLAKGWGYAILSPNSIQADNGGGLTQGIIGLANRGQPRKVDDWGALRAWAWGASRALDYFETDRSVDAKWVGIEGLSRYGKAAAVAMAYEPRFAVAFVGSSGAGGLKLHRRDFGERVENVASSGEYHWMAGNYLKYAGPLTARNLPVDAHQLLALCAPRPVFISVGSQGENWVDARGMFLAGVHAGPVYELLGKKGLGTADFPPQEVGLLEGEIAFRQHEGGHTTGPNWPTFLRWADRYLAPTPR